MLVSRKLLRALSSYWEHKFKLSPKDGVDATQLLATPTEAVLRDSENAFAIIHNVREELALIGTSEKQLRVYTCYGFAPIAYFFSMFTSSKFCETELAKLVEEVRQCHGRGAISRQPYQAMRKAAKTILSYRAKGCLDESDSTMRRGYKASLADEFEKLVRLYVEKIGDYHCLSANTLASRVGSIRGFLAQLEQQGVKSAADMTHSEISECITQNAHKYSRGSKNWVETPRQFLRFLHYLGVTAEDYSFAIPDTLPRKRIIRGGFTEDEITRMLGSVDKESLNGRRDYAFMIIAARTGLRGIDIVNLKLGSIDWRSNEIRISQQKTGNAFNLPLVPEVGNAIADYILNVRPETESEYIFVKRYAPTQPVGRKTVTAVVKKYMNLAKIDSNPIPNRGLHSFRRSFGKNLLEASVPIDMINELLGHADMNSSKPYLAIDESGLRNCALSLISLGGEGGQNDM